MRTRSLFITSMIVLLTSACCDKNDKGHNDTPPCDGCCVGVAGKLYSTSNLNPTDNDFAQSDLVVNPLSVTYAPEGTGYLYAMTAVVTNNGSDDCSKCSRITVLLPIESDIRYFTATADNGKPLKWTQCDQVPANNQRTAGMITVEVPDYICQTGDDITTIKIACSAFCAVDPANQLATSFAVFAGSSVPDPVLSNNYGYWNRQEAEAASGATDTTGTD